MNFRLFGIIFLTVTLLLSSDAYAFSLTGFFSSLFKEPAPPTILDTYVSPVKVYPGQTLRVLVEVDDAFGIKEAYADFHHELGSDKVNLIPTFEKNGKYALQASWVVHDTKNLAWYDIGVTVVNNKDLSATATVKYQDPTVSHPASQIEAGTFPAGNFTFSNDVKIMGVLSGGSPLKISGGINLTDVPGSTPTNTTFDDNTLFIDVSNNRVGIGTKTPSQVLEIIGTTKATAFQGDGSQLTGIQGVPSGAVMFFVTSACPSGWTELTTARGRYVVGLPTAGTMNATAGTVLSDQENRVVGQHLHSVDPPSTSTDTTGSHQHGRNTDNDVGGNLWSGWTGGDAGLGHTYTDAAGSHSHSVDIAAFNSVNSGSIAGTNAPYIQLLA